MRVLLQRVAWANVCVEGRTVAEIGAGLLALVAVERTDDRERVVRIAHKTADARLFDDGERRFQLPIDADPNRAVLCVSQFTLYGDLRRGNRPSWSAAAAPDGARALFDCYVAALDARGVTTRTGVFGAHMELGLLNDGPVTVLLDSDELERTRR